MSASPSGQALPTVAPVPLAGRADAGAQGMPSEVVERPAMVIPIPLTTTLVASTVAGKTQLVGTQLTHVEVASAVTGGS